MLPPPAPEPASIWSLKPWWCQPWSIMLTGIAFPTASWLLWQRLWITAPLAMGVLLWWALFLVLVPTAWRAEQHQGPS
ncbi:MAG: DUF6737 family protein [Cyanobacteriota bacterium]